MKIINAELYNNENVLHCVECFQWTEPYDYEVILDFFELQKKAFGHSVISRNKVNALFSDGIRVVLKDNDLILMQDLREYVNIVKVEGINE